MKKVIINENILRRILMEMVKERGLLNEISTVDAWNRFYKDKIPQEDYLNIMKGTEKMTPFHKACLNAYIEDGGEVENKSTKAKEIGEAWEKMSMEAKQFLIKVVESRYNEMSFFSLHLLIKRIEKKTRFTENSYSDDGYHVIFENDRLLVTCTTSYSAQRKYYGDSHWCTASDIFGDYNGFEMFEQYTSEDNAILLQFVDKQNRQNSYQGQYGADYDNQLCNFFDKECNWEDLVGFFKERGANIDEVLNSIDVDALRNETEQMVNEERDYWYAKYDAYIKRIKTKLAQDYSTGKYDDSVKSGILNAFKNGKRETDGKISMDFDDISIDMRFTDAPDGYYVAANIFYFGCPKFRKILSDLYEKTDDVQYPQDAILAKVKLDKSVEILNRVKGGYVYFYENIVVIEKDHINYVYTWSNPTVPIANGEHFASTKKYVVIGPQGLFFAGYETNGEKGCIISRETGKIVYNDVEELYWYQRKFVDAYGKAHSLE